MTHNSILIGIGYAGCKMFAKAETDLTKLYLDTDPDVIEKYSGGVNANRQEKALSAKNIRILRIGENVCGKYPAMGDAELAEKAVEETKTQILEQIVPFDKVVIITSLGGGTSNGATKKLAEISVELKKEVIVVCGLPFEVEGYRLALAQQTLKKLEEICEVKSLQYEVPADIQKISWGDCQNLKDAEVLKLLDTVIK